MHNFFSKMHKNFLGMHKRTNPTQIFLDFITFFQSNNCKWSFIPKKYFKRFAWKFAWWQTWKTIENRSLRLKYSCCIDLNLQNWFWCRGLVEHWGVYCRKNEHYRWVRPPRYSTGIDDDVIIRILWRCWKCENMKRQYFPEFVDLRILQWFAPIIIC